MALAGGMDNSCPDLTVVGVATGPVSSRVSNWATWPLFKDGAVIFMTLG